MWWPVVVLTAASCTEWPPVVSRAHDVDALPVSQREIRCIDCDDEALAAIGRRFPALDYLFINDQSRISDGGIRSLLPLRALRQLEAGNGSHLTDASITTMNQLPALEELSIEGARLISSAALQSLGEHALRRVFLVRCANADDETLRALKSRLPNADVRVLE